MKSPEPIWNQNVTFSIKFAQDQCQQIALEISAILEKHGQWTVKAAEGSCYRLNVLSKRMELHRMYHELLVRTLKLVEYPDQQLFEHTPPILSSDHATGYYSRNSQAFSYVHGKVEVPLRVCTSSSIEVKRALEWTKKCSKSLLRLQLATTHPHTVDLEDLTMVDDWSTTQSTIGIMTPTEDWSDLGSVTTEIGHTPAITRHSLQLCGYAAANFLRLLEDLRDTEARTGQLAGAEGFQRAREGYRELLTKLLHGLDAPKPPLDPYPISGSMQRVVTDLNMRSAIQGTLDFLNRNNYIEESFGQLPGSTPLGTADIEAMHRAYGDLVLRLHFDLAALLPFQNDSFTSAQAPTSVPAPVSISTPEVSRPVVPDIQSEACIEKTLETIIDSMESKPTQKDVMKLVFHWTTLEECNGFKRADVMKFD